MITSFFKPKRGRATVTGDDAVTATATDTTVTGKENKKQKKTTATSTTTTAKNPFAKPAKKELSPETVALISYLHDEDGDEESSSLGMPTWRSALDKHVSSSSFQRLASFVDTERKKQTIFPPPEDTFAALNLCPLSKIKLVIVGQDPYHGPNQAHGLCFSVRKGIQTPPSLRNVYKELKNDPGVANFDAIPTHGNLERWAKQGVLLINNVLTVRKGQAHSHKKRGWEELTDAIIRAVDKRAPRATDHSDDTNTNTKKAGLVFLLWGKPATEKTKTALNGLTSSRHTILCSSHPSPLGATKTKAPFTGSRCFSKANEALVEMGHDPIDWRVDGPLP